MIDTPISESTIVGAAVGMALTGLIPVVEMRVIDFALCAMDEIINQAAKNNSDQVYVNLTGGTVTAKGDGVRAASNGAGLVKVTVNGKNETQRVEIDASLFVPGDKGVVEDLIVAAANDARTKVEQTVQEQMKTITGGLPLPPGFKL